MDYVDAQGVEYEVPDNPNAEQLAFIKAQGLTRKVTPVAKAPPSSLKDALRSAASGIGEGVLRAPFIGGDLMKLGMVGVNAVRPGTVSPEFMNRFGSQVAVDIAGESDTNKFLKDTVDFDIAHQPETRAGDYTKAITSAIAGAAATGGMGAIGGPMNAAKVALSPASLAINGAAGGAAQLGLDVSRDFDREKQGNPLVAAAAGLATGVGGNMVRSATSPNLNQLLYNATKDMKGDDWMQAGQGLKDFQKAGSTSFTMADLPKLQERIGGLAQGASNTTGGNQLGVKLGTEARFNQDIPALLKSTAGEIGPAADPRELAARLSSMGDKRIGDLVKTRSNALEGSLRAAPDIDPQSLRQAAGPLFQGRIDPGDQAPGMQAAIKRALAALSLDKGQPTSTNVRTLSQAVKGIRNIPSGSTDSPAAQVGRSQQMRAGTMAEEALEKASPQFKTSMDQYKGFNENILDPMERSLVGGIRGATDGGQILSRLRKVPVDQLGKELNMLGLDQKAQREIARLIADGADPVPNLTKSSDLSKLDRQMLDSVLANVNPDLAASVGKKLSLTDSLGRLSAEHAADRTMGLNLSKNPLGTAINPMGTISMRAGLRTSEKEVANLAELLSNPSPANLAKLREIAKVDPRAQKVLQWVSSMTGGAQNSAVTQ